MSSSVPTRRFSRSASASIERCGRSNVLAAPARSPGPPGLRRPHGCWPAASSGHARPNRAARFAARRCDARPRDRRPRRQPLAPERLGQLVRRRRNEARLFQVGLTFRSDALAPERPVRGVASAQLDSVEPFGRGIAPRLARPAGFASRWRRPPRGLGEGPRGCRSPASAHPERCPRTTRSWAMVGPRPIQIRLNRLSRAMRSTMACIASGSRWAVASSRVIANWARASRSRRSATRPRSRWLPANRPITTPAKSRSRSVSTSSGAATAKELRGSMKSEVVDEERRRTR